MKQKECVENRKRGSDQKTGRAVDTLKRIEKRKKKKENK